MDALRQKYPAAKLYYADVYGVYKDMLKKPAQYSECIRQKCEARHWAMCCDVLTWVVGGWRGGVHGVEFGDERGIHEVVGGVRRLHEIVAGCSSLEVIRW